MARQNNHHNNRGGNRRDRNASFESRSTELGYYLIVTDGEETEPNYFNGLRDSIPEHNKNRIVIKVHNAKTPYLLVNKTIELCASQAQQRKAWIVFDRDRVKGFDDIIKTAEENDINVGWSNPCFEVFLLAYFGKMPAFKDSQKCWKSFADLYKRITGQEYLKNNKNIYEKVNQYGDFHTAYNLAEAKLKKAQEESVKPSEAISVCTVHRLVKEIVDKVDE